MSRHTARAWSSMFGAPINISCPTARIQGSTGSTRRRARCSLSMARVRHEPFGRAGSVPVRRTIALRSSKRSACRSMLETGSGGTENDHRRGLFNADQARIEAVEGSRVNVVTSTGLRHELERSDPMLRRLDLAYALNAHMAQG